MRIPKQFQDRELRRYLRRLFFFKLRYYDFQLKREAQIFSEKGVDYKFDLVLNYTKDYQSVGNGIFEVYLKGDLIFYVYYDIDKDSFDYTEFNNYFKDK